MTRILHVIQILTLGGAARALIATARCSGSMGDFSHRIVSLLPAEARAAALAAEAGLPVIDAPGREALHREIAEADIVQVHWWNVPEIGDFLRGDLPPARMMGFFHVAGDRIPHVITPRLLDFLDMGVPCNPYTYYDTPLFRDMEPERKITSAGLVYGAADLSRLEGFRPKPHEGFNVGYIGTIDFIKMHPDYVAMSAAIRIPDVKFVVCGDGSLDVLRQQAAHLGAAARFDIRGYVEDVRGAIAEFDVYGYPLCEETYAGSELNLQEVMYAGLAPVVFPYGGVKRLVVNDFTGLIVHSAREYRQAVEHLYHHPAERRRMGRNARAYAEQIFGAENAARKINALYARMLERPKRARTWPDRESLAGSGSAVYLDTLGDAGRAYAVSRSGEDLAAALMADDEIADSTRLAMISGILAYSGRYPADPHLHYWAGLVFARMGSHEQAAMRFVEAIQRGYPHWRAHWRLVEATRAMGRPDLAAQALGSLERIRPGYRAEIEDAGREAREETQRSFRAEPEGPAAVTPVPDSGGRRTETAALAVDTGASPSRDWTAEAPPEEEGEAGGAVDPAVARAEEAFASGRAEDAEALLNAFLASQPGHARALSSLGAVQHALGKRNQAIRNLLDAVKADPGNATALLNLAEFLAESDRHQEALGLCYRYLDERPDHDRVLSASAALEEAWADRILERSLVRDLNYRRKPYRVTALVSTYKSEAFMRECLEDLEGQSIADDLEIVVVDAASPENEGAIVEEFQRRYGNIRYVRTPERIGIYPAWNLAVRISSGDNLTPFSTNDRLNPDAYRILRDALAAHPEASLVYGDTYLTHLPHQRYGSHVPCPDFGGEFRWPEYSFEDLMTNCRVGPHPMWRREVHAEVGYFDGRYKAIGDQDFWLRIAVKRPLLHIPEFTGLAWITKDSLSGQSTSLQEIQDIHVKHTRAYLERIKRSVRGLRSRSGSAGGMGERRTEPSGPSRPAPMLPEKRTVTALVSTYDSEAHIRGCLEDLTSQSLFREGRMEVIVVDSGSTQGERRIVEEFQAAHPGIVYIRSERETIYGAWNRAVQAARGRYLVTANTDDRHREDAFEIMASELEAGPEPLAYADALLTDRPNETYAANSARRAWKLPDFNPRQALIDCPFGCTVMWRRTLHGEFGLFGEQYRIAGDYEFFLKVALARGARHLREPLTLYLETPSSLSYASAARVEEEVNRFIVDLRQSLPLERIYPFLAEDGSPGAKAAAAVDFGACLIDPFLGRPSPVEAERLFRMALEWAGPVPEIEFDLALALFDQGRQGDAQEILARLATLPGWMERIRRLAHEPRSLALARLPHPGLRAMAPVVPVADTRVALPAQAGRVHA